MDNLPLRALRTSGNRLETIAHVSDFYATRLPLHLEESEIISILENDSYKAKLEREYKKPNPYEIRKQMLQDGVVTQEQALQMRQRYLYDRCEALYKKYLETSDKKYLIAYQKIKLHYEISTYRPVGNYTDEEIELSRKVPLAKIMKLNKGFSSCPFHTEKTPSFKVYGHLYYCFGCGAKGNAVDYVMKQMGYNFKQAITYLKQYV